MYLRRTLDDENALHGRTSRPWHTLFGGMTLRLERANYL